MTETAQNLHLFKDLVGARLTAFGFCFMIPEMSPLPPNTYLFLQSSTPQMKSG